jgi:hypothetical protein
MTLLVVLVGGALADTITLDSGAALEGTLTHYEIRGTCNIHVDDGGLSGADVVLPCTRIIRMERRLAAAGPMPEGAVLVVPDEQAPEEVAPIEEVAPVEELAVPLVEVAPMTVGEDLAGADVGVEPEAAPEEPLPPAPAPEEETPVAAVSPEEPAPAETEEKAPEAAPERNRPLDRLTWPKIRLDP